MRGSSGYVGAASASALAAGLQRPADCGQTAPLQPLSLSDAVALALCHHPRTQQSWAQWQARTAELRLQRAEALPTGTASIGLVVIGVHMDERVVRATLDACLLNDAELQAGPLLWQQMPQAFPVWKR